MPLLYFLVLLFKHISVILGNTGRNGRRHDNIEERQKKFSFCLYIVDLSTITGSSNKLNKTLKAQS